MVESITATITARGLRIFILVLLIAGCGTASWRQGRRYLADGKYDQSIEALENALNEDPDNPKILRDLGIAHYKAEQYEQSLEHLEEAKKGLEKDSRLSFYLGLVYEQLGQYDKAIEEYANYTRLVRFSRIRRQMQQRIEWITRQQAAEWVKERMKMEEEIDTASIPDNTIAVTYFKPFSVSEDLEPLHKGLTALLIIDLSMVESLKVVERTKMKELYDELGLSSTDLVDQDTAPRIGKLLGANSLITGAFTGLGNELWRIDPALGQVKAGKFETLESIEGQFLDFVQLEKQLVLQIVKGLDIELTKEEQSSILENVPTNSLQAFLAYSRGIDYTDKGMYTEATKEFETAISLDPNFNQAKDSLTGAKLSPAAIESADELEAVWDATLSEEETREELLTATAESVSQEDVSRTKRTEPKIPEKPLVPLEIHFRW